MLDSKLQIILFIASAGGLCTAIHLIKRHILLLKYAFIWMAAGISSLIMAIFPQLMADISCLLGIQAPSNALYLLGFCFVLAVLFNLTVIASKNSQRVMRLTQELAILKNELEEYRKSAGAAKYEGDISCVTATQSNKYALVKEE